MGCRIVNDSMFNPINTVSIDEYIKTDKLSFIKMDIEGAEKEALLGGCKTLKKYSPKLAVCLYHKIEDIWEIPLLIKEIQPEYKLYLRQYDYSLFDTICYAVNE